MAELYHEHYPTHTDVRTSSLQANAFSQMQFSPHQPLVNTNLNNSNNINNHNPSYSLSNSYMLPTRQQPFSQAQQVSPHNGLSSQLLPQYQSSTYSIPSTTLSIASNQYTFNSLPFSQPQTSSAHSGFTNPQSSFHPVPNSHSPQSESYSVESTLPSLSTIASTDSSLSTKNENYLSMNSPMHKRPVPTSVLPAQEHNNMFLPLDQNYPGNHAALMSIAEAEYYDMSPRNARPFAAHQNGITERFQFLQNAADPSLTSWNTQILNPNYPRNLISFPFQQSTPDPNQRNMIQNGTAFEPGSNTNLIIAQNQNLSAINANKLVRPIPPLNVNVMLSNIYLTVIHCGIPNPVTGARTYTQHCTYWNQEMDVYTAVNDPAQRILYRAALLSDRFQCATNKVGMYLARRRGIQGGIFQATGFEYKPETGGKGLKVAAYFITKEACMEFEKHWRLQAIKRVKRTLRDSKLETNESEKRPKKEPTSIPSNSSLTVKQ